MTSNRSGPLAQGKRITIREVAAEAGVSAQTVSRVLNGRPDVAPETVERVREVISKTGYQPNMLARSLTQGRSRILGVVAYGQDYFGPAHVLTAIERRAAETGYAIMLNLMLEPDDGDVDHLLSTLAARQVDGIIWAIPAVADNRACLGSRLGHVAVPMILVGGMSEKPFLPTIGIDNAAIGRLATEHLLAGEARHIGLITGPRSWWEAREREAGWRETLRAHDTPIDERLVVEGDWTVGSGADALYQMIETDPDLDAVFASNDQMALGVMYAAHRLGIRIPDDLSVVGVDDLAEGSHFWPPLTTVRQPLDGAGEMAIADILERIGAGRQGRHQPVELEPQLKLLQPTLIVRQSSRPVPDVGSVAGAAGSAAAGSAAAGSSAAR